MLPETISEYKNKLVNPDVLSNPDALIQIMIGELERRGFPENSLEEAKKILADEESRKKILREIEAQNLERKARQIKNEIDSLTNDIVMLRYRINEASKIMGKRVFEDNGETARISHALKKREVIDQDSLHLFIDDVHKYIVQSASWNGIYEKPEVKETLEIISQYRNSFDHVYDMKGSGNGSDKAYKKLGDINEKLLGHKILKIEEYSKLQIAILTNVRDMLNTIETNAEEWLK